MTRERKYILIDCQVDLYELAYEYCKLLQKNGDYYQVNMTTNEKQFDVKSVSKEELRRQSNEIINQTNRNRGNPSGTR
jgi:hypothetical protein